MTPNPEELLKVAKQIKSSTIPRKRTKPETQLLEYVEVIVYLKNEKRFTFNEITDFMRNYGIQCRTANVSNIYYRALSLK